MERAVGVFRYKDWNSDGIKDLSYVINGWYNGGHGPIEWRLWLVGKEGNIHKVKGFEELNDPKIDSITNHIFTNIVVSHEGLEMDEYKFSNNKIIRLKDNYISLDDTNTVYTHKYDNNDK